MKFALISHVMPPSWSGQAMMLSRLLAGLDPDDFCLISAQPPVAAVDAYAQSLSARYYHLPHEIFLNRGFRYGLQYVRRAVNFLPGLHRRARRIAEIVEREGCGAIVACSGDLEDLPAAYLASRRAGVPFYPYYFDYYSHQFAAPEERVLAQAVERLFIRRAATVISTNEVLSEELRRRYGVGSRVLHNPCDLEEFEARAGARDFNEDEGDAGERREVRIVYTGAVYDAHFDAFRNLLRAVETLGRPEVKLHLYTAQSPAELAAEGVSGPIVFHEHQHVSAMPAVQRRADVLFLPLAFASPYPVLVRTSATSKLGEYLASGRPILGHAPAGSFVSWYLREHDCGVVVDENDSGQVADALAALLDDRRLRARVGEHARRRAALDFDLTKVRAAFAGVLGLDAPRAATRDRAAGVSGVAL